LRQRFFRYGFLAASSIGPSCETISEAGQKAKQNPTFQMNAAASCFSPKQENIFFSPDNDAIKQNK
jgi:hypothetical protein